MEKTYNRKNIKVKEMGNPIFTSWGNPYSMYVSADGVYYADSDDNSDNVIKLGVFETLEEAQEAFICYMQTVEATGKEE